MRASRLRRLNRGLGVNFDRCGCVVGRGGRGAVSKEGKVAMDM
jgi:hypothetical protein